MKVYGTIDEGSTDIWLWLKPDKGNFEPILIKDTSRKNYQRPLSMDEIDKYCCYSLKAFKKKFKITDDLKSGSIQIMHLPDKLVLDNKGAKYKLNFAKDFKKPKDIVVTTYKDVEEEILPDT